MQEKQQKQVAATYAWSTKTKHKAFTALLSYSQFRRTRAQQTIAARHHHVMTWKAGVLGAWRGLARYLAPIRTAVDVMTHKVSHLGLWFDVAQCPCVTQGHLCVCMDAAVLALNAHAVNARRPQH